MTEVEARLWPVAQFATNQQLIQGLSIQERDSDKGVGGGGGGGYYRTVEGRTRGGGRNRAGISRPSAVTSCSGRDESSLGGSM